ncbi:MAG TPA: RNA polymerase sigma factor [Candidatus Hydrogenedentes bacterium]|nr:RNA polymerase sigma factor [Candidatus Hydrogenedentota bacterium]
MYFERVQFSYAHGGPFGGTPEGMNRIPEKRMNDNTECTDEQLMISLCDGDDSALEKIVKRYQNDVFRFCLHYLGEMETAREISQETFLRVFTARDRFDATRPFRPWMLCIARNMCLNIIKRNKVAPMDSLEGLEEASSAASPAWYPATEHPLENVLADERRRALLRLVYELPEDARELLMMRYFEQLSAREIAEVLETTEGAVRTRTHRALNQLRERCVGKLDFLS